MRPIPDLPADSELAGWIERDDGGYASFIHPDDAYVLTVDVDDPIRGYLLRMWELGDDGREVRIAQAVVEDGKTATQLAAQLAAAADDLAAVTADPSLGPEKVYREDVERGTVGVPDSWNEDAEAWEDALRNAFEKAEIPRSKGTLTTKTIDDREYYYLQWREGDTVTSQYVAPVNPQS
jgi:hypothetical protein